MKEHLVAPRFSRAPVPSWRPDGRKACAVPAALLSGQNDEIEFIDEPEADERPTDASGKRWLILVVDDDPSVHEATLLALGGERIHDRPLALLHAHSARQAKEELAARTDVDLILLDVVMETGDAGLVLARAIRQELGLHDVKIVIRTGQAGLFSEQAVRELPEVDGYLTKSAVQRSVLIDAIADLLDPAPTR